MKNTDLSYGDIVTKAMKMTDRQEVGETYEAVAEQFCKIFSEAIEGNRSKGVVGKYYIWIRVQKDPYAANALHLFPMCRRTRPSPYETEDHYLWHYDSASSQLSFCWCIPRKEITAYVLANPTMFDQDYVRLLRKYRIKRLDIEFQDEWTRAEKEHLRKLWETGKITFKDCLIKI